MTEQIGKEYLGNFGPVTKSHSYQGQQELTLTEGRPFKVQFFRKNTLDFIGIEELNAINGECLKTVLLCYGKLDVRFQANGYMENEGKEGNFYMTTSPPLNPAGVHIPDKKTFQNDQYKIILPVLKCVCCSFTSGPVIVTGNDSGRQLKIPAIQRLQQHWVDTYKGVKDHHFPKNMPEDILQPIIAEIRPTESAFDHRYPHTMDPRLLAFYNGTLHDPQLTFTPPCANYDGELHYPQRNKKHQIYSYPPSPSSEYYAFNLPEVAEEKSCRKGVLHRIFKNHDAFKSNNL